MLRVRIGARHPVEGDGVATPIKSTDPETSLDLQTTAAVAPKASIHLIQASDGPASLLDGFSRALGQPGGPPDVATLSYGGCGVADAISASTYVTITNEVLAMLAMSGTSTFIAAGDDGSTTCPGPGLIPTLSFSAVSPVVTAVGGTRLTLDAQNQRASEVVWNDAQFGEAAAGGGGLALDTARPAFQDGFNSSSEPRFPTSARWPTSSRDGPSSSTGSSSRSVARADHRHLSPPPQPLSTRSRASTTIPASGWPMAGSTKPTGATPPASTTSLRATTNSNW